MAGALLELENGFHHLDGILDIGGDQPHFRWITHTRAISKSKPKSSSFICKIPERCELMLILQTTSDARLL